VYWRYIIHYTNLLIHNGMASAKKIILFWLVKTLPSSYRARNFLTVVTGTCLCYICWASLIKSIFSNHIYLECILILVFHLRLGLPSGVCTFSQNLRRHQSCVMNRINFMLLTLLQLHLTPPPHPPTHTHTNIIYVTYMHAHIASPIVSKLVGYFCCVYVHTVTSTTCTSFTVLFT